MRKDTGSHLGFPFPLAISILHYLASETPSETELGSRQSDQILLGDSQILSRIMFLAVMICKYVGLS